MLVQTVGLQRLLGPSIFHYYTILNEVIKNEYQINLRLVARLVKKQ